MINNSPMAAVGLGLLDLAAYLDPADQQLARRCHADQGTIGGQLQHGIWIGLAQLDELLGGKPQAAAVDQRQGDGPERLLRTQQPWTGRGGERRRCGAG